MKSKSTLRSLLLSCSTLLTISSLHAAPLIYEPFADSEAVLNSNTPGTGLTGTWTATTTWDVLSGSSLWGSLAFSGNKAQSDSGGGASVAIPAATLSEAGLLNHGATLWFSLIYTTAPIVSGNPDAGFALATNSMAGTNNVPITGGSGIGFTIKTGVMAASTWVGGSVGRTVTAGAPSEPVTGSTTYLIVGEIIWGADGTSPDTINLYRPDNSLTLGAVVATRAVALDQSGFDTVTFANKGDAGAFPIPIDEIRFGATSEDVLPVDTVAPTLLSITDNMAGGPIIGDDVAEVTYTLAFDRPMDISTITAADFNNAGTATIDSLATTVAQVSPAVITVKIVPTGTGTLQLRIPATSVLSSFVPLNLDTTADILDDTEITINTDPTPANTPTANRWWEGVVSPGITNGVSAGGAGTWDNATTTNWDRGAGFKNPVAWDNALGATAIFGGTAGTVTLAADITLNKMSLSTVGYTFGGSNLNFAASSTIDVTTDATGTMTFNNGVNGSPAVRIPGKDATNIVRFNPASVSQALGVITNPYYDGAGDKGMVYLDGSTTGNTVAGFTYQKGAPVSQHYGFMEKRGTGTWTINGDVEQGRVVPVAGTLIINGTFTSLYQGLQPIPSNARVGGALNYYQSDSRFGHFTVNSGGIVAPGNPAVANGVGTIVVEFGTGQATVGQTIFNTGSIYEWQVGPANVTDKVHVRRTATVSNNNRTLTVGAMTLKILDVGGAPSPGDKLTVFTYDAGVVAPSAATLNANVTIELSGTTWTGPGTWGVDVDGSGNGTIYITGLSKGGSSPYDTWANGTFTPALTEKLPPDNQDGDILNNLQEFAFGTQPTVLTGEIVYSGETLTTPGGPKLVAAGGIYSMVFGRRADYVAAGLTYTVQFSADLDTWVDNDDGTNPPVQVATDGTINAMSVPFVNSITTPSGDRKPTFSRVKVALAP